ncbi:MULTISPECIES: hypothetical protein [Enterobacteriaceae]|uniref:hypothetical protein n=1 Tax=Enterobacteriaceae TaxID=543 RepID=UPI000272B0CB|nr:hypothetical protein [Enterobacter sp. Ag1]EJF30535.1 hypothetical protein A936_14984 [Enterobacter sp. Ag1]
MKTLVIAILTAVLCQGMAMAETQQPASGALPANEKPPLVLTADEKKASEANADRNECWSARNCSGKILNNKDAHNCKNSGGKSWRGKNSSQCTNL